MWIHPTEVADGTQDILEAAPGWIAVGAFGRDRGCGVLLLEGFSTAEVGTQYTTQAAAAGTLSVTVSGTGNLAVRDEVEVWPDTSGSIGSVNVSAGDVVAKGDVLYTLDGEDAEANTAKALATKRQAEESVQRAQLSLTQARNSLAELEKRAASTTSTVSSGDITAPNSRSPWRRPASRPRRRRS